MEHKTFMTSTKFEKIFESTSINPVVVEIFQDCLQNSKSQAQFGIIVLNRFCKETNTKLNSTQRNSIDHKLTNLMVKYLSMFEYAEDKSALQNFDAKLINTHLIRDNNCKGAKPKLENEMSYNTFKNWFFENN